MSSWNNFCSSDNISYLFKNEEDYFKYLELQRKQMFVKNTKLVPRPGHVECRKCKSNLIWLDTRQVRSGDEGATTFAQCNNCKHKWTMN